MQVLTRREKDTKIIMITPMGRDWKHLNPNNIIQVMPLDGRFGTLVAVEYKDEHDAFNSTGLREFY